MALPPLLDSPLLDPKDRLLHPILESFDHLILFARKAIAKDWVNLFDQHRVNSFLPDQAYLQPLYT